MTTPKRWILALVFTVLCLNIDHNDNYCNKKGLFIEL